jgi:hypothetical protein
MPLKARDISGGDSARIEGFIVCRHEEGGELPQIERECLHGMR